MRSLASTISPACRYCDSLLGQAKRSLMIEACAGMTDIGLGRCRRHQFALGNRIEEIDAAVMEAEPGRKFDCLLAPSIVGSAQKKAARRPSTPAQPAINSSIPAPG